MDSILRAFGRKTSKEVESNEKVRTEHPSGSHGTETSQNTSDEDLFGNLVVCSPTAATTYHHIQDIGDLDVKTECKNYGRLKNESGDDDGDGPSAFMNKEDEDLTFTKKENCDVNQDRNLISGNFLMKEENEKKSSYLDSKKVESIGVTVENKEMVSDSSPKSSLSSSLTNPSKSRNIPSASGNKTVSSRPKKKRSVKPGFGNIEADTPPNKSSPSTSSESSVTFTDNIHSISMMDTGTTEASLPEVSSDEHHHLYCEHDEIHNSHVGNVIGDRSEEHDQVSRDQDSQEKTDSISTEVNNYEIDIDTEKNETLNSSKTGNEMLVEEDTSTKICTSASDYIIDDVKEYSSVVYADDSKGDMESEELHSNEDLSCNNSHNDIIENESNKVLSREDDVEFSEETDDVKLSEEDNFSLKLSVLQSREENLEASRCLLFNQQKELIDEWRTGHLSEDEILLKIQELRLLQSKLECDEDYDKAAEINQNIEDLIKQCDDYRYQYPLLDGNFIDLMEQFRNLCNNQKLEYNSIIKEYEEMLISYKTKNYEDEINEEKKLNEMTLLIKERKLKVERDMSHTSLDKEHLAKTETVLDEEIEKQTKELDREKCDLVERKIQIQENIQELMEKLKVLKEEEYNITSSISKVDSKIQKIMDDFQPHIFEISNEKDRNVKEESLLEKKMEDVIAEEELVKLRKTKISNQREKNEETIIQITAVIQRVKEIIKSNGKEIFCFDDLLDFEGLDLDSNSELIESKIYLETLKSKQEDINNKVLCDEGEEKRLQRSLNDLEAQLSELQSLKQTHVKERKYKDAKQTSDEIKKLTGQGEDISHNAMILNERIKAQKNEIHELNNEVTKAQEKFSGKELAHDQYIIKKLKTMNNAIENLLNNELERWTIAILELQLFNNDNIIQALTKKHGFSYEKVSGNVEIDIEAIQRSLVDLEKRLELAVAEEDWDCADEINTLIEEKKQIIVDSNR